MRRVSSMKKLYTAGLALFLLAGCGQVQNEDPQSTGDKTKDEQTDEVKDSVDKSTSDQNNEENNNLEEEPTVEQGETNTEEEMVVEKTPQYKVNEANWSIEPITDANEKVVLLTIDDAPDQHALQMATTLKELKAPAIFFVNGHFLDTPEEKEIVKKIHEMGFLIGNHTYSHSSLPDLTQEEQKEEILSINKIVEEVIGEKPKFFRAPFGQNTDFSKELVAQEGMILMNWTYGYDWEAKYQTKEALADIMVNTPYLNNGANLLMHDRSWTNEALSDIVNGLRKKGFEIVDPELIQTTI